MSFLKSLFGAAAKPRTETPVEERTTAQLDYKGYVIRAVPFKEQGQFQLAGIIEKPFGDEVKRYRFVRAARSADPADVSQLALAKGQTLIDEQGDALFG